VQRVPVRITLDVAELKAHPLRLGLSMNVGVDVADTHGNPITNAQVSQSVQNDSMQLSRADNADVEARIAKIIDDNSGNGTAFVAQQSAQP